MSIILQIVGGMFLYGAYTTLTDKWKKRVLLSLFYLYMVFFSISLILFAVSLDFKILLFSIIQFIFGALCKLNYDTMNKTFKK